MHKVSLPKRVVEKLVRVSLAAEELHGELEDYLMASQPRLVKRLRQARREHLTGKTRPFVFPR